MNIVETIEVPTGHIIIVEGEHGLLELLSLGDYGKDVNLNPSEPVTHTSLLPLTKKWVITISTQYGCRQSCLFCDAPRAGSGRNATLNDLLNEVKVGISIHPDVKYTERLNIHFARMGEPTWNPNVLEAAIAFKHELPKTFFVHPVVSTMMPRHNPWLKTFIREWIRIKNEVYQGDAGLQISINSTNEDERNIIFARGACTLEEIADIIGDQWPKGRKFTLNFAVADWEIDPKKLLKLFSPEKYIIKLTPMHRAKTAEENNIATPGDYCTPYPYQHHADALRASGYEVLVFIASREEDEGRITCGNAILSGTKPFGAGIVNK